MTAQDDASAKVTKFAHDYFKLHHKFSGQLHPFHPKINGSYPILFPRKTTVKKKNQPTGNKKEISYLPVQLLDQDLQIFYELLLLFSRDKDYVTQ
jgi:hypothetical protein